MFHRPLIMGIINVTNDSFYGSSRVMGVEDVVKSADAMIAGGADILDIGAESTRPGSSGISEQQQIERVVPAIGAIRDKTDMAISIDTRSAQVAQAALDAGATWINDISAMHHDARMARLAAERSVPIVLMHMQGQPETMQDNPFYADVIADVREFFHRAVERALSAGISKKNIILDPGIGFGKRVQDNLVLLKNLDRIRLNSFRLLVGLSRKSFLGHILDGLEPGEGGESHHPTEERLVASLAAEAWCLNHGVDILRVHDVQETRQMIAVWEALAWTS